MEITLRNNNALIDEFTKGDVKDLKELLKNEPYTSDEMKTLLKPLVGIALLQGHVDVLWLLVDEYDLVDWFTKREIDIMLNTTFKRYHNCDSDKHYGSYHWVLCAFAIRQ